MRRQLLQKRADAWKAWAKVEEIDRGCATEKPTVKSGANRVFLHLRRSRLLDQADAFFRFLRQPNNPSAARPLAKSGNAAGTGVAIAPKSPWVSVLMPSVK
jgi:hypothetical protein